MNDPTRIKVYARQRGLSATSKRTWLENIGQHAELSFWNVAYVLTPAQRRRYTKKTRRGDRSSVVHQGRVTYSIPF